MSGPYVNDDGIPVWTKDPIDSGPYGLDFKGLFPAGDVIATSTWSGPVGVTVGQKFENGTVAAVMVSGGTLGTDYEVECTATSSSGSVRKRSLILAVR